MATAPVIEHGDVLEQIARGLGTGIPPPSDGSESAERALRGLYPFDSGRILDFSEDRPMSALLSELVNVQLSLAQDAEVESQLKQRIRNAWATRRGMALRRGK